MAKERPYILVVDDEKDLADSIAQIIESTDNYKTVTVYSALQAIDELAIRKTQIQLIVLDIKMPEMDGLQFLQKIRLEFPEGKMGVIILTAWEDVEKWRKARMANVAGYLKKPFKADDLIATINRFFTGKARWMVEQTRWDLVDREAHLTGHMPEE